MEPIYEVYGDGQHYIGFVKWHMARDATDEFVSHVEVSDIEDRKLLALIRFDKVEGVYPAKAADIQRWRLNL